MGPSTERATRRRIGRSAGLVVPLGLALALGSCSSDRTSAEPSRPSTASAPPSIVSRSTTVTAPAPATTGPPPRTTGAHDTGTATTAGTLAPTVPITPVYTFPFTGKRVSFGSTHHDYPAIDVFGCGATVVAPTSGVVAEVSTEDHWDPTVNDPATRGGKFVSMQGVDGVRYYFAHLDSVAVRPGTRLDPGTVLGVMGQTGNARNSACHTHVGFSWMCPTSEWAVRRGKVWPQDFLTAWRNGEQRSPADAVALAQLAEPNACAEAAGAMPAGSVADAG